MRKLKIDFGSGHNPKKGYKTCDITFSPFLDFVYNQDTNEIIGCDLESVDEFFLRNVVHHLPDIERTFNCLTKYLKRGGTITIVDVRKEFFKENLFLDNLWYRQIIPRQEVWIAKQYRDYMSIISNLGFERLKYQIQNEKEVSVWKKL